MLYRYMANLNEAFNSLKFSSGKFQNLDYFFTQRTLFEETEYIDKHMSRQIKKNKVTYNFLALNIPINTFKTIDSDIEFDCRLDNDNLENSICDDKKHSYSNNVIYPTEIPVGFTIEIFGDEGYHYKGLMASYAGHVPNFMIPIKDDKKIFININYKFIDNDNKTSYKKYVSFIEVPKRFQTIKDLNLS